MGWSRGVGGVAEVKKNITPLYEQPNGYWLIASVTTSGLVSDVGMLSIL